MDIFRVKICLTRLCKVVNLEKKNRNIYTIVLMICHLLPNKLCKSYCEDVS